MVGVVVKLECWADKPSRAVRLASGFVGRRNIQNTIGIDVEGDFDLRNTTGCWGNARKFELVEGVVIFGVGVFTVVHLDEHTRLVVGVRREGLRLRGRDSGVMFDEGSHDTTSSFNTEIPSVT